MSSIKKKAISAVIWNFLQRIGSQGISFTTSIILARILVPEQFGLIGMIGVFFGIGKSLMDAGLGQSLIRTKNPSQADYSTVFYFNLIGSLIIYMIIYLSAPYISIFYEQPILTNIIRILSITFIINAFGMIQGTRLTKLMDFKTQMKISIPSLIISGATGIILAYNGFGVWSLVYADIARSISGTIQLWLYAKWYPSWIFDWGKFKYHFNFGYKLTLSGVLNTLFQNAYVIIIGKVFQPAQVGFYNRANGLKQLPVDNISSVLSTVTYPLFAEIKNDDVRLKSIYKKIMQLVIFLVAPLLLILSSLAEPLFRFLLTEKWLPAVPYFQILCWNGILYPIHSYNLNILKVKGRSDLFLKLEIVKKTLIILMIAISINFGIYGLLYGSVLSSILAFFINSHYTGKFLNYKAWEQAKDVIPIILLAALCAVFVSMLDVFINQYTSLDLVKLIIGSLSGGLLYLSLAYIFKFNSLFELLKIIQRK